MSADERLDAAAKAIYDTDPHEWARTADGSPNAYAYAYARAALDAVDEWVPTKWWSVVGEDGQLWAETSDEKEARGMLKPGSSLQRLEQTVPAARMVTVVEVAPDPIADAEERHRHEWADHLQEHLWAVGASELKVEDVIEMLRRPQPPFGKKAGRG